MAIEKMMFVRATGPLEKLNEFNLKTLSADFYHPENAADFLGVSEGYHAVTQQCPFEAPIKMIEEMTETMEMDLSDELTDVFSGNEAPDEAYLLKLEKYVAENDFESSDINMFLSGLKPKVEKYSDRYMGLVGKKKELEQQTDKLKHFEKLDVKPADMLDTNYVEVHFGSLPKDSMIKLYMYDNDNKFIFNSYASDEKYFWGVYCTMKQYADEAERVMSALYFDELKFPEDSGTVPEMIKKCNTELEAVEKEMEEIENFWKENRSTLANDLSVLLDLQCLWSLRKFAAVKEDSFCCLGWIPAKSENEVRQLFDSVGDIEFTIKDPKTSVTASGINQASPFETSIRDIEHLAHHVNFNLTTSKLHNCIGKDTPVTDEYIKKITKFLGGAAWREEGNTFSGLKADIHAVSLRRKELKARTRYLNNKVEMLCKFRTLDVDLGELMNVSYSVVRFGRIPEKDVDFIQKKADEIGFIFNVCSTDGKNCWCVYVTPKKFAQKTSEIFDSVYFKEYKPDVSSGMITDIVAECEKEIEEIDREMQSIAMFWHKNESDIIECYSFLQDMQRVWNAGKYITKKKGKYVYTGTATRQDKRKILALYEAVGPFSQKEAKDAPQKEKLTPPTKLKNSGLAKPYEYYVKMYGMPTYGSIDITTFVAITYTVLFGIMFGDLGQGFVLFLGGLLFWKKKKMELARIIIPCGVSSMVCGLIFGSFFGYEDLLDPLYHAVGMKGKPLEVMESINTVLLIAISIGIVLVAVSIIINIYANVKAKKFGAALFDNNGLAGLIFYMCGVNLASGMMKGPTPIPGAVCGILIGICAVILFMKEILIGIVDKHDNWKPERISDFVMQNVFEMLEYVLSYFSNTVSFLRVGAFVLVHAGMMMVVFSLAGESRNIFVIILGNILIIALEGLLTGIQALRLEFYEMFSRCFEGSGRQFTSARQILAEQNKQ